MDDLLKQIIFDISLDNKDFFEFAYILRETDTQDEITKRLLDGRLKPAVLVDIILSNKYEDGEFVLNDSMMFNLYVDKGRI